MTSEAFNLRRGWTFTNKDQELFPYGSMEPPNVEWSFCWLAAITQATLQEEVHLHSPISIYVHKWELGGAGEATG